MVAVQARLRSLLPAARRRLAALRDHRGGHLVCPLLDQAEGACLVYAHRPGACRTYGCYVERGDVLGCSRVLEAARESGEEDAIVWGNEDGVRYALATLSGEPLPLTEWLALDPPRPPPEE